jgi:micrococcal nuclease
MLLRCLLLFLVFLMGCQPATTPQGFTAKVDRVISGQVLEIGGVEGHPEITERIVLNGIAVPDLKQQPWGEAARSKLEEWVRQQPVLVESDLEARKQGGQRLVYLWQGKELLNEKLVAEGYALAVSQPPNTKYDTRLFRAQDRARILGLGIWNPEKPLRDDPAKFWQQS